MLKINVEVDNNVNYGGIDDNFDNFQNNNVEFDEIIYDYNEKIENNHDIFQNNKKKYLYHIIDIADVSNEIREIMFDLYYKDQYDDVIDLLIKDIQFDYKQIKNLHNLALYNSYINNFVESNNIARRITIILINDEKILRIDHIKYFIRLGETDIDLERYEDALKSLYNAIVVLNRVFYTSYQNNNQISNKDSFIYDTMYINFKKEIDNLIKKSKSCIGFELASNFQNSKRPKSKLFLKKKIVQCISVLSMLRPSTSLQLKLLPPHSPITSTNSSPISSDKGLSCAILCPCSSFNNSMQKFPTISSPNSGLNNLKSSLYSPIMSKVTSRVSSPILRTRPNTPITPSNTRNMSPVKRLLKELSERFNINIKSNNIYDIATTEELSEEYKIVLEEAEKKLKLINQINTSNKLSVRKFAIVPIEEDIKSAIKVDEKPKELVKGEINRRNLTFLNLSKPSSRYKRAPTNQILERVAILKAKSKKSINF